MTISAYDRHGSDEHSALSEEQLTGQLEAGDQIEAKPAAPKKPSRSKKATPKKTGAKKTSAKKAAVKKTGAKKASGKKAGDKETGARTVAVKKAAPSAKKPPRTRKTLSTNKQRLAGEKQVASQEAEATEQLQTILFANAKLQAFLELQDKADARKNRQQKAGKTDGSATGLLWTLSALALAACGGGGGSPAPRTGGEVSSPGASTPVKGAKEPQTLDADFLANILLSDAEKPSDKVVKAATQALEAGTEIPMAYGEVNRDSLTNGGVYSIETAKIQADKMVSVQVGGIVDPLTGVQIMGGGVDKDDIILQFVYDKPEKILNIKPVLNNPNNFTISTGANGTTVGEIKTLLESNNQTKDLLTFTLKAGIEDSHKIILVNNNNGIALSGGTDSHDILMGKGGADILDGGDRNDRLTGGTGADRFVLDKSDSGTDIVTDFSVSDGDKIRIDTVNGSNDDTIAELNRAGYYIRDNQAHTNITNADNSHIYMTLNNIGHDDITNTSFDSYFEII